MFSKIEVNGPNTHPVFHYLKEHSELHDKETNETKDIPWNFASFLVDSEGTVKKYKDSEEDPNVLIPDIEKMLNSTA